MTGLPLYLVGQLAVLAVIGLLALIAVKLP